MATIQTLAAELAAAFVNATRTDGTEFVKLADGSPDWMSEAIQAAHGDMFPDDWRYRAIKSVALEIADAEDIEDARHESIDGLVDIYTSGLTQWLNSRADRACYCDDAAEEFGFDKSRGIIGLMQLGQYAEFDEIWGQLVGALESLAEESGEDEDCAHEWAEDEFHIEVCTKCGEERGELR